jgi:hypothetical protein
LAIPAPPAPTAPRSAPLRLYDELDLAVYQAIGADPAARAVLLRPGETWRE